MPRGDRTGPRGFGPMTGRGAGYCAGYAAPGYMNPGMRGGMGYGRGRGFVGRHFGGGPGWGGPGYAAYGPGYAPGYGPGYAPYPAGYPTLDEEREMLSRQVEALEHELQLMRQRMQELSEEGGD